MNEYRLDLQEFGLKVLHRNGGFDFTDTFFPYTSGEIGPYFVQSGVVMNNGDDYVFSCKMMSSLINNIGGGRYDLIAGGETRDWIFSNNVATDLGLPSVMIYKNGKMVGAKDLKGKSVALVCDLNNEGTSPRDYWVPIIKDEGGIVEDIFFYVDRMEGGVQVMRDLGLDSHAAVPLDSNAWDFLQKMGAVSSEVYHNLQARMENKGSWARDMLQSEKGLARLAELYDDANEGRSKVEKVMKKGYPDLNVYDYAEAVSEFTKTSGRDVVMDFERWRNSE